MNCLITNTLIGSSIWLRESACPCKNCLNYHEETLKIKYIKKEDYSKMNDPHKLEHLLPNKNYYIIYYTDNYIVLEKRFSNYKLAKPFIEMLEKNPDFHLIRVRAVLESDVQI